jgi:hypothetical protein
LQQHLLLRLPTRINGAKRRLRFCNVYKVVGFFFFLFSQQDGMTESQLEEGRKNYTAFAAVAISAIPI